ncbi:MAG: proton-conducting transporter membrane subunit, partial [Pseudomonadota bacterium]
TDIGLTGSISHMFNHAIVKACLFLAVGCIFFSTGVTRIENMAGIGRTMPLTMAAFVIAGLGLIGVPGTAGFVSKWYLVQAAADVGNWLIIAVIMVSSVLAVIYLGRVVEIAWFREPKAAVVRKPPVEMMAMTWVLALATIWFGVQTDLSAGVPTIAAAELLAGWAE